MILIFQKIEFDQKLKNKQKKLLDNVLFVFNQSAFSRSLAELSGFLVNVSKKTYIFHKLHVQHSIKILKVTLQKAKFLLFSLK